jgi:uncharacterized protein (TIGR02147 family)
MKKPLDCDSVAEFLLTEFARRKLRNESYSLRAFARDLELSASRMSELLKNKKNLSEKLAHRIAERLRLKANDRDHFKNLVLASSSRDASVRGLAKDRLAQARQLDQMTRLSNDQFQLIADWQHAAILELTQVEGFRSDSRWIAKQLGLGVSQIEEAISRLVRCGLLHIAKDGSLEARPEIFNTFSETPSTAIRRFHRQVLSMAIESTIEDDVAEREHASTILAIPKSQLHVFREKMNRFVLDFWKSIEHEPKNALYGLTIQLFPIRDRRRTASGLN